MATTALPTAVRRDILAECGMEDCRIVSLLAGCYGSYDYMEASYGVTRDRCERVMRGVREMPEWIAEEHDGFTVSVQDVTSLMREAWNDFEAADYWYEHHGL